MDARDALLQALREDGYPYAKVNPHAYLDRARHTIAIELEAEPGPLAHYGKLAISAGGISARLVEDALQFRPGDRFDSRVLAAAEQRLYDTGLFAQVRIDVPQNPSALPEVTVALD